MDQSASRPLPLLGELSAVGWLAEQPAEFRERIGRIGHWIRVSRGERLYSVGDAPTSMFGLAEGLLDICIPIDSDEEVVLHRAGPGFWIGDAALLSDAARSISVEAARDCRLFEVPGKRLARMLEAHPGDWRYLHRLSYINVSLALRVLGEVLALRPRVRFARLLLRLASRDGVVHASQEELGRMAGMSRAAFRRTCAPLIDAGIVELSCGAVRIRDMQGLVREAGRR